MKSKYNDIDKQLNSLPKPNLDKNIKQNIYQSLLDFRETHVKKEKRQGIFKNVFVGFSFAAVLCIVSLIIINSEWDGEFPLNGQQKVEEKEDEKLPIETKEEKIDPQLIAIKEILSDFELPQEGIISEPNRRKELIGNTSNDENLIVYENGFVIDKETKSVIMTIHFDGNSNNPPNPEGTQALAMFKALLNSEFTENFHLLGNFLTDEQMEMEITDQERKYMKHHLGNYDPNISGIGGWYSINSDIERTIKSIERVEGQLIGYQELSVWLRDVKNHYVKAREFGVEDWEASYTEYIQGAKKFDDLLEVSNEK